MTDTAVNSPVGRLCNWFPLGRTSGDANRRGVSLNRINSNQGKTWADVPSHVGITLPRSQGCTNLIIDGWAGGQPSETVRYNDAGTALTGVLHANALLRANGTTVDGYATPSWLYTGMATGMAALTTAGDWWGVYSGKFGYPAFAPTNSAPHSWPLDISHADYSSLTKWRAMFEPVFANGGAFVAVDASGGALSTDCEKYFQTICENIATHTGASLGAASFTGSFTNDRVRRMYVEAVANMSTTSWASSWIANYDVFEASVGDSNEMQISQTDYPPIILCVQVATADDTGSVAGNYAFLHDKALSLLQTYTGAMVAVKYEPMSHYEDMADLVAAGGGTVAAGTDSTDAGTVALQGRSMGEGRHR